MAASLGHVLEQIQRWVSPRLEEFSDAVLLERFIQGRDESAFAALVARHGAMVLRSCRRIVGDSHEAEDAFQATFLILARKAQSLRRPDALPGYLHSIARRVALKARMKATVFKGRTPLPDELPDAHSDPLSWLTARELLSVLEEEVARLPGPQRSAVLLCCLEGRTQEEAARLLGWTAGSLRGHLERGRNRLQARLLRRGIALLAALAVVAVSCGEAASALLLHHTVKAALDGGMGSSSTLLAQSVLKTMLWSKWACVVAVVLVSALAATTTAALVYRGLAGESPEDKKPAVSATPRQADAGKPKARTDALGDPLPEGAIRRLGTLRFRCGWGINNLLPTPDGKTLISNEAAGTVSVWDLATGKLLRQFPGNLQDQKYIALSPDGKLVGVGYRENIIVWDLASGKEVRRLAQTDASGVAFSPDGKSLAAAGTGDDIRLWNLTDSKKITKFRWERGNHYSSVLITYTPDGKTLIAGQWFDSKIGLWDVASGKKRQELDTKAGAIFSLALSPDGAILAAGSRQSGVHLWDVKTGQLIRKLQAEDVKGSTVSVTFSPDGKSLAAAETGFGKDDLKDRNCLHIWDVTTGKELSRFKGGNDWQRIAYSRDGKTLIVASFGVIRLLDVATWKEIGATAGSPAYFGHYLESAMRSADGSTLAYRRQSDVRSWETKASREVSPIEIRFWDMNANREINSSIEFGCFWGSMILALAPDGRTAAISEGQSALNLWDVRSGKLIRPIQPGKKGRPDAHALAFSPNGRMLASADDKAAGVRLWDVATGKQVGWLPLMKTTDAQEGNNWSYTCSIAFSPDSRLLAAAGRTWAEGCGVRIWEIATGKELPHLTRRMNTSKEDLPSIAPGFGVFKIIVPDVAYSPNGKMLAKNERPKTISIWEAATGQQRLFLKGHEDSTVCIRFTPDNRTLASSSWDSTIRLWDLETGRELRKLTGHRGKANSLAFSADGKILVSTGDDTTILFWDVADLTHRKRLPATSLTEREWQTLWEDLAKDDATKAYAAMIRMTTDGPTTIVALKARLHPIRPADAERLAKLLKDLDSDDFAVRETAGRELEKLGDVIGPTLRQTLERPGLSLELRRRLEALAASLEELSGNRLRQVRAIEVLEMLGTAEAQRLLQTLAAGAEQARQTREARAALQRLRSARRD
jgi:RNA polymerase sigma factor (sigma-70 family)